MAGCDQLSNVRQIPRCTALDEGIHFQTDMVTIADLFCLILRLLLVRSLQDKSKAEDLAQETFVRLPKNHRGTAA
jgi:hypothetical protein